MGLGKLDLAATAGGAELDAHAATSATTKAPSSLEVTVTYVPPQNFCDHGLQTRASAECTFAKGGKAGKKCRTPTAKRYGYGIARVCFFFKAPMCNIDS